MEKVKQFFRIVSFQEIFFLAALIVVFYFVSTYNFLLFHGMVEILSIVIAGASFLIFYSLRKITLNSFFLIISISLMCAGFIDLFHTLAYKGMGVFANITTNEPTQLWIAARYFQSITFLLAIFLINKEVKFNKIFGIFFVIASLLISSILYFKIFPVSYIEGFGLTPFKIYSEYIISSIFALFLFLFAKNKDKFSQEIFVWFVISIVATIISELTFTTYVNVYGSAILLGHMARLIAFYYIYKAMISYTVLNPLIIFSKKITEEKIQLEKSVNLLKTQLGKGQENIASFQKQVRELEEDNRRLSEMTVLLEKNYYRK